MQYCFYVVFGIPHGHQQGNHPSADIHYDVDVAVRIFFINRLWEYAIVPYEIDRKSGAFLKIPCSIGRVSELSVIPSYLQFLLTPGDCWTSLVVVQCFISVFPQIRLMFISVNVMSGLIGTTSLYMISLIERAICECERGTHACTNIEIR